MEETFFGAGSFPFFLVTSRGGQFQVGRKIFFPCQEKEILSASVIECGAILFGNWKFSYRLKREI